MCNCCRFFSGVFIGNFRSFVHFLVLAAGIIDSLDWHSAAAHEPQRARQAGTIVCVRRGVQAQRRPCPARRERTGDHRAHPGPRQLPPPQAQQCGALSTRSTGQLSVAANGCRKADQGVRAATEHVYLAGLGPGHLNGARPFGRVQVCDIIHRISHYCSHNVRSMLIPSISLVSPATVALKLYYRIN